MKPIQQSMAVLVLVLVFALSSLAAEPLAGARWIGEAGETNFAWRTQDAEKALGIAGADGHRLRVSRPLPKNCLRLRKVFPLAAKAISRATVSVTGLGFYELWLNGRKVDPTRVLAPAMADPGFGAHYDTYDVSALLRTGAANALGVWLAPGCSDDFSRYGWMWLAPQRMILRLTVDYADGTSAAVVSDGSWQSSRKGPITEVGIYRGETYDATREDSDWALPVAAAGNGSRRACSPTDRD